MTNSLSTNVTKGLSILVVGVVKQANGCLASAWAKLAAKVGEVEATRFLEKEWECKIPERVREAGLLQKARFQHLS